MAGLGLIIFYGEAAGMRIWLMLFFFAALSCSLALVGSRSYIFLKVHEDSMRPKLCPGDLVLAKVVDRSTSLNVADLRRGDTIIFSSKEGRPTVKELFGLPGDRISYSKNFISNANGSSQSHAEFCSYSGKHGILDKMRIASGHFFALGKNLPESIDSRVLGEVPAESIIGKVILHVPLRLGRCGCEG